MSNVPELGIKDQSSPKGELLPPGESVIAELGIEQAALKSTKIPRKKRRQYRAVINWFTKYKPQLDVPNIEKVRGYLEAFYHLCEVEAWEKASKILFIRLNTPTNEELHRQLDTWGYYQKRFELCNKLLGKVGSRLDAILLNALGSLSIAFGEYNKAIEYLNQCLVIAQEISDRQVEGNALSDLGGTYFFLGDTVKAIEYYEKSLAIARQIPDRRLESAILGNLGSVYTGLSNYARVIEYHQQSLSLARTIGDRKVEAAALISLGYDYCATVNQSKYSGNSR